MSESRLRGKMIEMKWGAVWGTLLLCSLSLLSSLPADDTSASEQPSADSGRALVLQGGTVHTMEREGVLANATVVIRDGQIVAVGPDVEIPDDAEVIDARGYQILPGWIDVRSRLYLGGDSSGQSANDASLDALDGVDRFASVGDEVLASGVTAVYLQPSPPGTLGGFGASVATGRATSIEDHGALNPQAAVQMSLGVGSSGTSRQRHQQFQALKRRLKAAEDYQKAWEEYRQALAKQEDKKTPADQAQPQSGEADSETESEAPRGRGRQRRPPTSDQTSSLATTSPATKPDSVLPDSEVLESPLQDEDPPAETEKSDEEAKEAAEKSADQPPKKPDFDPLKERLLPALKREVVVRFEVQRADEIRWALELAKEFNLRLVLEGLGDMKSATSDVVQSQVPVVLGPWLAWEGSAGNSSKRWEQWSRAFGGKEASNRLVIATFATAPQGSKWLRAHAAAAVAAGMDRDQVLRGITIHAAQVAGVSDQLGSIQAGKRADLVLLPGDPLDTCVPVQMVIQAGQIVVDRGVAEHSAAAAGPEAAAGSLAKSGTLPPDKLPPAFVLVSNRVLLPDGQWQAAAVHVADGRIQAVGDPQSQPPGLPVFDLGEQALTPGLGSALVTTPGRGLPIARDSDASQQFAIDGFDGQSQTVRQWLDSGVLAVHLVNSQQNVLAGQTTWLRLAGEQSGSRASGFVTSDFRRQLRERPAAEQWVLAASARRNDRFPASLASQIRMIRQRLEGQAWETPAYLPPAAVEKLLKQRMATLDAVQQGKMPVVVHAREDAEIDAALRLIRDRSVQAWIAGPGQLEPFHDRLREAGVGVIANSLRAADHDWYLADLLLAQQQGIPLLLAGSDGQSLRLTAAALVSAGMEPEAALKMLTVAAAEVFAAEEAVGIQEGAAADWVVWTDNPLNLAARPVWNSVSGRISQLGDWQEGQESPESPEISVAE